MSGRPVSVGAPASRAGPADSVAAHRMNSARAGTCKGRIKRCRAAAGRSVAGFALGARLGFWRNAAPRVTRPIAFFFLVGLMVGMAPAAAQTGRQLDNAYAQLERMIENGRYIQALRSTELSLEAYPHDERLLGMRDHLQSLLNASAPAFAPATRGRPPPAVPLLTTPQAGRDFVIDNAQVTMLWVNPGRVLLADPIGSDNDTLVTFSQGFWLASTELTQAQWHALMEHVPAPSFFRGSDRPVESVSWNMAMEFCHRLTEQERVAGRLPEGYEYTLPTEAQWEYACRAGTTGPHAGDLLAMAWHEPNNQGCTQPVAQREPNAWGFYDMHGNVYEWCRDRFASYPGGAVVDYRAVEDGPTDRPRILRGGAWGSGAGHCRSAHRYWAALSFANNATGFRVALAPR